MGDDADNSRSILLAGIANSDNVTPSVLSASLEVKQEGWWPLWFVNLRSESGLMPSQLLDSETQGLRLGPLFPMQGHTYETVLSYDALRGYLSFTLVDRTAGNLISNGSWRLNRYGGNMHGVAGPQSSVVDYPWYEPVGVSWDVGNTSPDGYIVRRFLEPEHSLIRLQALGPLGGEYRVLSPANTEVARIPGAALVEGDNWLPLAADRLLPGATTLALQYVEDGHTRVTDTKNIVIGKVNAVLDNTRLNGVSKELESSLVVRSQSALRNVSMQLQVNIASLTWDSTASDYVPQPHSTEVVDLGRLPAITAEGITLPISVPVPDQPGLWQADFRLLADPDVATEVETAKVIFTTHTWSVLGNETLSVAADRTEAIYKVGEAVPFRIRVEHDNQPVGGVTVQWWLKKDGGATLQSGVAQLVNGEAVVTGSLDEPGFIRLEVLYKLGSQSLRAMAGAGIDPLAIGPSLPVPDDFDAFWAEKKALLAAVPLHAHTTQVDSGFADIVAYDVQVDALGAPVSGYLALPKNAKQGSLPAMIMFHGAGVASASLSRAVAWARDGLLVFDINAHGLPNGQPESYYTALKNGELADYRVRGRESRDEFYFLGMFLRAVRAIDYLAARPEWDGRTMILHGTSQGGAQAYAAAGLDPRVTFFVAGVSGMADLTGKVKNRPTGWPGPALVTSPSPEVEAKVLNTVRYSDAMNFATRVKADGFFTVGFIDTTCPPTGVYAAYNSVPTNKTMYNDVAAGHENTPMANRLMRQAVLDHVAKMKQ